MKVSVGTKYEGGSSMRLKDGDYELQIIEVKSTRGRVNMTLSTSRGQKVYKTFFLLEKDGKTTNERGMLELADYITTAMQIEDEEAEVDVDSALGFYLKCYVKNGSYEKEDGTKKNVYNVYSPRRCSGFSDGTGSLLGDEPEAMEEEEDVGEPVAEGELPFDEPNTDVDVFKKYGL